MRRIVIFIMAVLGLAAAMVLQSCSNDDDKENGKGTPITKTEPLVMEGKTWLMDNELVVAPEYGKPHLFVEMMLKGDSIINDIHFMKLYERRYREGETIPQQWTATRKYYGQDGEKVFMYDSFYDYTSPVVDFSLKVGDVFLYTIPDTEGSLAMMVTAVSDTILDKSTDQARRKCLYLQAVNNPNDKHVWVDGIGSVEYGILGIDYSAAGAFKRLVKCSESDRVLYQYE